MRIWFERPLPAELRARFPADAELLGAASASGDDPRASLPRAEGIVAAARVRYDEGLFTRTPDLRVVCRTGIGYDNVDVPAATARGIAVCNVPDGPTISTAEHTWTLLLAVAKKLPATSRVLRDGVRGDYFSMFTGLELCDRTLGLVGLGRIGVRVARMGQAFGMRVVAHDPLLTAERAAELGVEPAASLDGLLAEADVVSLHLPLTAETRMLFDAARLSRMRRGAVLINAARGGLIDEQALLAALESGHLSGAGLDVFTTEPPPPDHPLLAHPAVIATPHIAAATGAAKARLWQGAIDQVLLVLNGERPPHLLNPACWPLLERRRAARAGAPSDQIA